MGGEGLIYYLFILTRQIRLLFFSCWFASLLLQQKIRAHWKCFFFFLVGEGEIENVVSFNG